MKASGSPIVPPNQGGGLAAAVAASVAIRRSSQMTNNPHAMTIVAPLTTMALGSTDQKTQSIPNAQRIDEYSNGATTEGGARRNASVTQYCPSAPLNPTAASHVQSPAATRRHSGAARTPEPIPTINRNHTTIAALEFVRPKVRTMTALNA